MCSLCFKAHSLQRRWTSYKLDCFYFSFILGFLYFSLCIYNAAVNHYQTCCAAKYFWKRILKFALVAILFLFIYFYLFIWQTPYRASYCCNSRWSVQFKMKCSIVSEVWHVFEFSFVMTLDGTRLSFYSPLFFNPHPLLILRLSSTNLPLSIGQLRTSTQEWVPENVPIPLVLRGLYKTFYFLLNFLLIECIVTDTETSESGFFVTWCTVKFYLRCSSRFNSSIEGRCWVGLQLL